MDYHEDEDLDEDEDYHEDEDHYEDEDYFEDEDHEDEDHHEDEDDQCNVNFIVKPTSVVKTGKLSKTSCKINSDVDIIRIRRGRRRHN